MGLDGGMRCHQPTTRRRLKQTGLGAPSRELQEDLLPLGKDRLDAFHYASLMCTHMYEGSMLVLVYVCVQWEMEEGVHVSGCLLDQLIPMVKQWGWSASLEQAMIRRFGP